MKKIVTLLLLINTLLIYSQEKIRTVKLFSGYEYSKIDEIADGQGEFNSNASFDFLKSISIAIGKEKSFHEIELNRIESTYNQFKRVRNNNIVNGNETFATKVKIRYSYNVKVLASDKLKLIAGLSIAPYYFKERVDPLILSSYNSVTKRVGFHLEIIPRVQYALNESFFVEFNIPFGIVNNYLERTRIDNPAIPVRQQTNDEYKSDLFPPIIQASLGIGYKF